VKRQKRLQQNRLSALKCRRKKKEQLKGLMEEKEGLASENTQLRQEVSFVTTSAF